MLKRSRSSYRRAEGYVEYAIVTSLIMICSVTTMLTAGSAAMRQLAEQHRLCVIQDENCSNDLIDEDGSREDGEAGEDEEGEGEDGALASGGDDSTPWWSYWADDPFLASLSGIFGWWYV